MVVELTTTIVAIKRFFESDGGRKIEMKELQALSGEERQELGKLAAVELDVELIQK